MPVLSRQQRAPRQRPRRAETQPTALPRRQPRGGPERTRDCPAAEPTANFARFRVSTDGVPDAERVAAWREQFGPMMRLDVEAVSQGPFRSDLTVRSVPGLGIIAGTHSPFRVGRSRSLLADGNDDLVLLVKTGAGVALGAKREVPIGSGDAVLLSNCDVGGFVFSSPGSFVALAMPRRTLRPRLRDADAALLRPLEGKKDALRLLEGYMRALSDDGVLARPELRPTVVAHVHDLVALAVGTPRDAAELADGQGVRAGRLSAIRADIVDGLDRGGDLSVGSVAARHRVTPRYVQLLFEGEGTTFTQFVLGERLARAHRMLIDPLAPNRGIATVAFDAGFGDLSYFIRAFRRSYGATPSEVRDRAADG